MLYQQIKVSTGADVGAPDPLPADLIGNPDSGLANLSTILIAPVPEQYVDAGFIPYTSPPVVPTSYYLSKVIFERRLTDAQFAVFDGIRIQINSRPANWADPTANYALAADVRPFLAYEAADSVNVLDPQLSATLQAIQSSTSVFGANTQAADSEISRILTPAALPGEPAS